MTSIRCPTYIFLIASPIVLAACNSGQPSSDQASEPSSSPASVSGPQAYHAKLTLSGSPVISDDGKSIVVTATVTNSGDAPFGTDIAPGVNVNLGAHSVDTSGKVINQDLARASLPHIAAGASSTSTILLPVDEMLGNRAQILPVEENVAWFDKWGTKPLSVGPFMACSAAAVGTVCDAAGKPLSAAPAQQP